MIYTKHLQNYTSAIFISGYANAKIYKCDNPKCPRPACYVSASSSKEDAFSCARANCSGKYVYPVVLYFDFDYVPGMYFITVNEHQCNIWESCKPWIEHCV